MARGLATVGVRHLLWFVIAAHVPVGIGAFAFGPRFLLQFFISPFQFFILVPWLMAFYSLKTGLVTVKSGEPFRRDKAPRVYWINVAFCVGIGSVCFVLNLLISWLVVNR